MIMLLLEFIRLKVFLVCALKTLTMLNPLTIFIFSVLVVCEARMGIGLVVSLTRERGGEAVVI